MSRRRPLVILALLACPFAAAAAQNPPQYTNGTAFFVHPDGYMLTANHVIAGCGGQPYVNGRFMVDGMRVVAPETRLGQHADSIETTLRVQVLATDPAHDLALLKIVAPLHIENYVTFRDASAPLAPGEPVVAVGYPLTSVEKLRLLDFETRQGSIVQLDAPGAPEGTFMAADKGKTLGTHGYSGGPVLDARGDVIGINLAVACLGGGCIEALKQFRAAYGEDANHSSLAPDIYQQQLESHLDSSIVSHMNTVRAFTEKHALPLAAGTGDTRPIDQKIMQSSHAIANVGCTAKTEIERLKSMRLGEPTAP